MEAENTKKSRLERIVEQLNDKLMAAIEEAIDEGAKIVNRVSDTSLLKCCTIDGLLVQKNTVDGSLSVVLNFRSEKIARVFEPSKDELEKMAEQKRAELEEIEKQINAKQ